MLREEDVGQPGKTLHRMMLCQVSVLADCESEPSEDIGGGYTGVWPIGGISVSILLVIMILQELLWESTIPYVCTLHCLPTTHIMSTQPLPGHSPKLLGSRWLCYVPKYSTRA